MGNFVKYKWLHNCARIGLLASLGLITSACMENNVRSYGQPYAASQAKQSVYGHADHSGPVKAYYSFKPSAKAYVLHAQNNAATSAKINSRAVQPSVYQRRAQNYRSAPAAAQPNFSGQHNGLRHHFKTSPSVSTPQNGFAHFLDETRPIVPQAISRPRPNVQPKATATQATNFRPQAAVPKAVETRPVLNQFTGPTLQPSAQLKPRLAPSAPAVKPQATGVQTTGVQTTNYTSQFAPLAGPAPRATINQSLTDAVNRSPRLAIEDIKIQEAEEGLVQAKAQGRFKLNLEGIAGVGQYETDFSVVDRTDSDTRAPRAANLDLSLPIFQGGRIKAQKDLAKVGIKTAKANYDAVQNNVTLEAAVAHLNVIRDRQLIQIYARNVRLLDNQKQTVKALVNAGENTLTDEALLDARLASIQVRLKQVESNLAASESNYKRLTGRVAPDLLPVGQAMLPASLQQTKQAVLQNNHEVKTAQTQVEAAYHDIQVAKSFGRPKLALQGVLRAAEGQSDTIRRNSAAEVLLNLSVPLLSGGENKSRIRQAALAQSRAALETRALQENLTESVEQLWANVQAARLSQAPNQAQKIAAQKAYDAIVTQRNAGVATSLDVLTVEQTLLDAELNLVQAQTAENISRFQLLALMGALN